MCLRFLALAAIWVSVCYRVADVFRFLVPQITGECDFAMVRWQKLLCIELAEETALEYLIIM